MFRCVNGWKPSRLQDAAKAFFASLILNTFAPGAGGETDCATDGTGTPKLVRLYEHLGFSRVKGNNVAMTKEGYSRAVEGSRKRFERGGA